MTTAKPKKILVVEDESMMRGIETRELASNGFNVKEAVDGESALKVWVKERPDLVLLDLTIPEIDGFEVLKTIRSKTEDPELANTPVIVLSNLWSNADILRAKDLKIQGYLVKAYFTTDDILKKVQEVLGLNK